MASVTLEGCLPGPFVTPGSVEFIDLDTSGNSATATNLWGASNVGARENLYTYRTTDGATYTAVQYALPAIGQVLHFLVRVIGKANTIADSYTVTAAFAAFNSGSASLLAAPTAIETSTNGTLGGLTISVSGGNLNLNVTGTPGMVVDWLINPSIRRY
jgi:hypothetical protein